MLEKNKELNLKLRIVIILLSVFSLALFLRTLSLNGNSLLLGKEKLDNAVNAPLPVRIKIPILNVDATVEHVGIAPDGTMDVPTSASSTAWYELGPHPGEIGSAVIDGHAGWKDGTPAVFDYLYKLRNGEKIYIEDDKGTVTTFIVRKKETYRWDEDARDIFISNDGIAHLNLITCSGIWDKVTKTQPNRLVVFTDKE